MPTETLLKFSEITESPFTRATADQLQILYTRYELATRYASGKDVIEIACGAGVGLGMLARVARRFVGGDIDDLNVAAAQETYAGRSNVEIRHFDALHLPYPSASFDVAILFEALYYLPSADEFLREMKRVLRPRGTLLVSSVNCLWGEFNPSSFSTKYYAAAELAELLVQHGFDVSIYGGFPEQTGRLLGTAIGVVRKAAVRMRLIPRTQKSKEWLKRIFYGRLAQIPREIQPGFATAGDLDPLLPPYDSDQYRFIYAVAVLQ